MIMRLNSLRWFLDWSISGLFLLFLLFSIKLDFRMRRLQVFFNNTIRKMRNINQLNIKSGSLKKRKLKEDHEIFNNNLIESNHFEHWTSGKVNARLRDQFPNSPKVHNSTISWWMNKDLHFSYKRLNLRRPPEATENSFKKLLLSAALQFELVKRGIEIIFIDKFHVNTRHHRFRGWAKKDQKG